MNILVTGSAGFIGFHLANLLLRKGHKVYGFDGLTPYYDVTLKKNRRNILLENSNFSFKQGMLEDMTTLKDFFYQNQPDIVIHLAAQAGVRYSLENPRSYIDSNILGTFNIMEMAKKYKIKHFMIASTSSVYGSNIDMPFKENSKTDTQLTIYAATKKANENLAHSYSHLWNIPTTIFRFFTVYGPWGRPDMALFKFVKSILEEKPIDVYNQGAMYRDFTYVEDLVLSINKLMGVIPKRSEIKSKIKNDSLSPVAPYRVVNIGNSQKVKLNDFIEAIETILQKKAVKNYLPMQTGDVPETWADASLLENLTGYRPNTHFKEGILKFIEWYKKYYNIY